MKHRFIVFLLVCAALLFYSQRTKALASEEKAEVGTTAEEAAADDKNMSDSAWKEMAEEGTAEEETAGDGAKTMAFPQVGFTAEFPLEILDLTGVFGATGGVEMERDCGITYVSFEYCAMTKDEYRKINEKENASLWDTLKVLRRTARLFTVYGVDGGRDFSAINEYMNDLLEEDRAQEIAKAGEYTFYLYSEPYPNLFGDESAYEKRIGEEFSEEYRSVLQISTDAVKGAEFYEPEPTYLDMDGTVMSFETVDMDGNRVNS